MQRPIIILDFGSQYTQLIARRIRDMGVYCEIYPYKMSETLFIEKKSCGIILSGGPATVTFATNPSPPDWVFNCGLPVLGICYGMQVMAVQLGGQVCTSAVQEFGYAELRLHGTSTLFNNISDRTSTGGQLLLDVWMSHGDQVTQLPQGFELMGETENTPIAAMANKARHWYGVQFHPEVTHTTQGANLLRRFVIDICCAESQWTATNIIQQAISNIREQVGQQKVLLGLSGGVDSSVVACLLHKAIGKQLICVFVDTGLLRFKESEQVLAMFSGHMGLNITVVSAEQLFLKALDGITCPEQKRKIIGHTFVEVFEQHAAAIPDIKWLAQGTIYPDVIESAGGDLTGSEVIKSHHNVGGLPSKMNLQLLEPIRELFKDEVRKIGLQLGLPHEMIDRHPFPGPGLGVRILGEVKKEYADILRAADAIFIEELYAAGLYHKISQAFAVFLPIKSVGVVGDGRRYEYVICLRAIETIDFMTAHWAHLPWDFLAKVSNRIINEVARVSRVTYDISGKPPATIEWE